MGRHHLQRRPAAVAGTAHGSAQVGSAQVGPAQVGPAQVDGYLVNSSPGQPAHAHHPHHIHAPSARNHTAAAHTDPAPVSGWPTLVLVVGTAVVAVLSGPLNALLRSHPRAGEALTVFTAVVLQALPFLVAGVLVSGLVGLWATPERVRNVLPRSGAAAVCVAGVGGALVPGCECGTVPVARRLSVLGVPEAAALSFLLAAPATNPVVIAATYVAFRDVPEMALARFLASMLVALAVGWIWLALGHPERTGLARLVDGYDHDHGGSGWERFVATARADFITSVVYLVLGAAVVAVVRGAVPASWLDVVGGSMVASVLLAAALAVVLSLCSESDAFVAAAMTSLPLGARLVFLVVGPVVDLKLVVMYAGVFGRRFAAQFAPLVFAVAVVAGVAVGALVLGGAGW